MWLIFMKLQKIMQVTGGGHLLSTNDSITQRNSMSYQGENSPEAGAESI